MSTVAQVIAKAQRGCPLLQQSRGLELFNDVWSELLKKAQLRNSTEVILVSAGVREYDLPSSVWLVHDAFFEQSSNPYDWRKLRPVSTDQLIAVSSAWRSNSQTSTPQSYYLTTAEDGNSAKGSIGLDPAPNGTSTSGYPRVRLYTTKFTPLTLTDNVPATILNDNVFVWGIRYGFTGDQQPERTAECFAHYSSELEKCVQHIQGMQTQNVETMILPPVWPGTRVV